MIRKILFTLLVLLTTAACRKTLTEDVDKEIVHPVPSEKARLTFTMKSPEPLVGVKSAIGPDEDRINDLMLAVYHDGLLQDQKYIIDPMNHPDDLFLELSTGQGYNCYAWANCGKNTPAFEEKEFQQNTFHDWKDFKDIGQGMPMSWSVEGLSFEKPSSAPVTIVLKRRVAKINFSFDKSQVPGFRLTDVRLCQMPSRLYLFRNKEGSAALSPEATIAGDHASPTDIRNLQNGLSVSFYTLENRQGVLLEGNTDPWKKTPDHIPDKAGICTYLEVEGIFSSPSIHVGKAVYRLFLGKNNKDDFNLDGNTVYKVCLTGTDQNFKQLSWKIDAQTSLDQELSDSWFSRECMHDDGIFYIGEHFRTCFRLTDELAAYLGNPLEETNIRFIADETDGAAACQVHIGPMQAASDEKQVYLFDAYGDIPGQGSLWLFSKEEEPLLELQKIKISTPLLVAEQTPAVVINGHPTEVRPYLADTEGRNLEESLLPFEKSLFRIHVKPDFPADRHITLTPVNAGIWTLSCNHDGKDNLLSDSFIKAIVNKEHFRLLLDETIYGIQGETAFQLDLQPICVKISQTTDMNSIGIKNPSRLPLKIDFLELGTGTFHYDPAAWGEVSSEVQQHIYCQNYSYISFETPSFRKYYGSQNTFQADFSNTAGDPSLNGGWQNYNLTLPNKQNMEKAIIYANYKPEHLAQVLDVGFPNDAIPADKLSMEQGYSYIPVWKWSGAMLMTKGQVISAPPFLEQEHHLIPSEISRLETNPVLDLDFSYISPDPRLSVSSTNPPSKNPALKFSCSGSVEGSISAAASPGAQVEKYTFTEQIEPNLTTLTLNSSKQSVDGGAIWKALERLLEHTMEDWSKGQPEKRHAVPEQIRVIVSIVTADRNDRTLYRIQPNEPNKQVLCPDRNSNKYILVNTSTWISRNEYVAVSRK